MKAIKHHLFKFWACFWTVLLSMGPFLLSVYVGLSMYSIPVRHVVSMSIPESILVVLCVCVCV